MKPVIETGIYERQWLCLTYGQYACDMDAGDVIQSIRWLLFFMIPHIIWNHRLRKDIFMNGDVGFRITFHDGIPEVLVICPMVPYNVFHWQRYGKNLKRRTVDGQWILNARMCTEMWMQRTCWLGPSNWQGMCHRPNSARRELSNYGSISRFLH